MRAGVIGSRVVIVGESCSGKSTLAATLAGLLDAPFVELDALNWAPNWTPAPDQVFRDRIVEATKGDRWVVAGSYHRHAAELIWPRMDTLIWLDFPPRVTYPRIILRSWRRWRSNELLWGTNRERFWQQFKLWDEEASLIGYSLRHRREKQARFSTAMLDPRWTQARFLRLRSPAEVSALLDAVATPSIPRI